MAPATQPIHSPAQASRKGVTPLKRRGDLFFVGLGGGGVFVVVVVVVVISSSSDCDGGGWGGLFVCGGGGVDVWVWVCGWVGGWRQRLAVSEAK